MIFNPLTAENRGNAAVASFLPQSDSGGGVAGHFLLTV